MAWTIDWSERALADLHAIVARIAHDNQSAAGRIGNQLVETVEQAVAFPEMGRVVPEKRTRGARELIVAPYRIIYLLDHKRHLFQVVRIWHAARGAPPLS